MSKLKGVAAFAVAMSFLTAPALAQGDGTGPVAEACKADIEKFCAGIEHGEGKVRACLEEHKDEVSEACKKALETTGGGR